MKAVRVRSAGVVAVEDMPEPYPEDGEVVVRVIAASVCSTDRKIVARGVDQPRVLGHEVAGRLEDGTVVGVHPEVSCSTCDHCRHGWDNRCARRRSVGIDRDGGLAEWVAVPADRLVQLGDLPALTGAMLEPLACVVHALVAGGVSRGTPALVIGGGAMGVLSAWTLAAWDCELVLAQRSQPRRDVVADLGIARVVSTPAEASAALGTPPEVVIVTAPGGAPLQHALDVVAVGGLVHAFAGTVGGAQVDANQIQYRHLRLVGSTGSRLEDYRTARDLVVDGAVPLDRMPHDTIPLAGVPDVLTGEPSARVLKTVAVIDA